MSAGARAARGPGAHRIALQADCPNEGCRLRGPLPIRLTGLRRRRIEGEVVSRSRSQLIAFTLAALALALGVGSSSAATRTDSLLAASGLVAAYGFDEGSGSAVADASGRGNAGTVSNTAWSSAGRYSGALSFDGKDSWVTVPEAPSLDLSNA